VNRDSILYERDLGLVMAAVAREISKFNPAKTCKRMERDKS